MDGLIIKQSASRAATAPVLFIDTFGRAIPGVGGYCEENLAQIIIGDQSPERFAGGLSALLVNNSEDYLPGPAGFENLVDSLQIKSHRFFHQNVLSRQGSLLNQNGMTGWRGADQHYVQAVTIQQVGDIDCNWYLKRL
jgi:hypothetical protein